MSPADLTWTKGRATHAHTIRRDRGAWAREFQSRSRWGPPETSWTTSTADKIPLTILDANLSRRVHGAPSVRTRPATLPMRNGSSRHASQIGPGTRISVVPDQIALFVRFRLEEASYILKESSRKAMTVRISVARADDQEVVRAALQWSCTRLHDNDRQATEDGVRHHVRRDGRCLAQRACAAFRSALLRSSGLTCRQRAAPRLSAVRRIGSGESFRLAMSRSSIARSRSTSGGRPV